MENINKVNIVNVMILFIKDDIIFKTFILLFQDIDFHVMHLNVVAKHVLPEYASSASCLFWNLIVLINSSSQQIKLGFRVPICVNIIFAEGSMFVEQALEQLVNFFLFIVVFLVNVLERFDKFKIFFKFFNVLSSLHQLFDVLLNDRNYFRHL